MKYVPNTLSTLRLALAPVCAWLIGNDYWLASFCVFVVAVGTDLVDGFIARRFDATTATGAVLDHFADFAFVTIALLVLAAKGYVPLVLPLLIVVAFVQYVIDSRILEGGLVGSSLGRWNGIAYFVVVGIPVTIMGLGLGAVPIASAEGVAWVLIVTTLLSIGERTMLLVRGLRRIRTEDGD